ncbi:hypothetical protein, partial [Pseudomonas sp. PB100]|uniref:hypothetical protein n=1 Tax=Pseudomonas sp. PB100 TaxID=2495427 RepID=UPI001C499C8D
AAIFQENRSAWFWGGFATQRGASPLTTKSLLTTKSPITREARSPQRPLHHTPTAPHSNGSTLIDVVL